MTYQLFHLPKESLIGGAAIKPSFKVSFFLTGTTTPTPVYTTSALSVAHTQPVQADSGGVLATVYLDPSIIYKASVYDQNDVLQYTVDPVNDSLLSAAAIGAAIYPRTAAEISAGVTPTNYAYPEGDARRYGAALDGSTNDTTAFQNAITVQAAGGRHVIFPPGNARITGLTFGSNVKIVGSGNKTSYFTFAAGTARTALKAADTALFNDGAVFEDFGIVFANSADIGLDLTSVSRASVSRVRIWGDASQVTRRGTCVLLDASLASCYANVFVDCDLRFGVKNIHIREAANANFFYGGQNLSATDCVYQEGATTERAVGCQFVSTRIETDAGDCVHLSGDVWGWGFTNCYIEAYGASGTCIHVENGDATLPPTLFTGGVVTVSSGATTFNVAGATGRILVTGQDAAEYTEFTGSGAYHLGLPGLYIGNPSGTTAPRITAESSDTNEDLELAPKGTGNVTSTTGFFSSRMILVDGVSAPSTVSGQAQIYVDTADGDLKIKFGDGTVKTIVVDT